MKNTIKLIKRRFINQSGFTLVELVVAMTVGAFIMGGALAIMTQLFWVTSDNSNYMAAYRQVQNAGDWISQDALTVQQVYDFSSTALDGNISDSQDTIQVDSTSSFPPYGVILIEDELIQYINKTDNTFEGCIRSDNPTAHEDAASVDCFITLIWTDWPGNEHQIIYTLEDTASEVRQLKRYHFIREKGTAVFNQQDSNLIAQIIDPANTSSNWIESDKELTVTITAKAGGYVLFRLNKHSEPATRTYKIHPRPLS
ncbi:type II secretion system protein J [Chloroflexota bacterium]